MKLTRFVLVVTGIIIVGALGRFFVLGAQFFSGNYPDAQLHNIPTSDMKTAGFVLMAFTFVPLLIGLILIFSPFLGTSGKKLKKRGRLCWAEVVNIERLENVVRNNGAIPCRVECGLFDDSGVYHTYYSDYITEVLRGIEIGMYVAVYVHPRKANKYYVDVSQVKTTPD